MAKNVCIATQKGGTGKTSTAHILALGLAHKGARVLLVDLDPQTNLTLAAGADTLRSSNRRREDPGGHRQGRARGHSSRI